MNKETDGYRKGMGGQGNVIPALVAVEEGKE
jgi:hypothetical protein